MYIRLIATWLKDKKKQESLISLVQTILIEDLRKIVEEKTGLAPEHQRLLYKGKELCDGQILNDYSVAPNDIVLLAKRIITVDDPQDSISISSQAQEEGEDDEMIPAKSKYYFIGDYVDTRENGSWIEAKILGIFKKEEEADEEDLIFKVQSAEHVSPLPYENCVKFEAIRPASHYIYKIPDLEPGMKVLANYNIDSPEERGNWYDFHIVEVDRPDISGTVVTEGGSLEGCKIRFIREFMRIEKPKLRRNRLFHNVVHKRKYPYECKTCKDNMSKKCKICSCIICGSKDDWAQIILCDECNKGFHLHCVTPPLETVPDGDWFCGSCKTDTSEIVNPGEKLKVTKKKQNQNTSKKIWGRGMACVSVSERNDVVPKNHIGPIPGVEVGTCWKFRQGVASAGVHRPLVAGIHGQGTHCAYSLVLSGGYEDDVDNGKEFYYTGAGGRDLKENKQRTGNQCFDQQLVRSNKALALNCHAEFDSRKGAEATDWKKGKPVRVVRSSKMRKHSKYAPKEGYRYDGTYKVVKYFPWRGKAGHLIWRYLLRRDDPTPAPWEKGGHTFDIIYPANYLASLAEKKKKEDLENQKPGTSGTSQKKRKQASDSTDLDGTTKKTKPIPYKFKPTALKAINKDTVNKQLWLECKNVAKEGQKIFFDKVKEVFICIICRSLLYDPLTLECGLNICMNCLKDSFKYCDTEDFACPHCRRILGTKDTFIKEFQKFKNHKLEKALNMLFPGYGKT